MLAVHSDGLYRAHPAQRWGRGFGGLSLLPCPLGTLPGLPPSVSPCLSPSPHPTAWPGAGTCTPRGFPTVTRPLPTPVRVPEHCTTVTAASRAWLGDQSCLGSPPSQDPLRVAPGLGQGPQGLPWSPGGSVSCSALAGIQGLRGQGSETGWPGPRASGSLEARWALPGTTPHHTPACLPHLLGSRWGTGGARARSEADWLVPSVPGPAWSLALGLQRDSTTPQQGVKLGVPPWGPGTCLGWGGPWG